MRKKLALAVAAVLLVVPVLAGEAWPVYSPVVDPPPVSSADPANPSTPFGMPKGRRPQIGGLILAGVLGNILGSIAGIYLGAPTFDEDHPESLITYWAAGSAFGSAMAVNLAGHSRYWKGNFGLACIGGALGAGLSWLIVALPAFQGNAGTLSLVPLLILPPIGAAIGFNASMKPRRVPENHALLNISAGKLALGVPDVQVRPLFAPGSGARPEIQFNVNVLSVEL